MRAFAQRCAACGKRWLKITTNEPDDVCPFCGSGEVAWTESWTWRTGPNGSA